MVRKFKASLCIRKRMNTWSGKIFCGACVDKTFRYIETLFVQGNQVRTDQNKPQKETNKTKQRDKQTKVCFDQYELDYLGRIKFIHVENPY